MEKFIRSIPIILTAFILIICTQVFSAYRFANFHGRPPIHSYGGVSDRPTGLTPDQIKQVYNLPPSGGHGTIAIVDAYDDVNIENDLEMFNKQFKLPSCTRANGCFEKHIMNKTSDNAGWDLETSLDVEWAHAIAPQAKILLVEATTPSGKNLLDAIDYARNRSDVVAVSMSWGGAEFSDELSLDSHFNSMNGRITYFASSGDNGTGPSWPAASPQVVGVGGTHVSFTANGMFLSETAWSGSGGGISFYEPQPIYQSTYTISRSQNKRAIPDVSYNADPASGFSVYRTTGTSKKSWYIVGGTSAGAPQWAAIKSLSFSADNDKFYKDKASDKNALFFRDIRTGTNGNCGYYCTARKRYDYVTGLGTPLTTHY